MVYGMGYTQFFQKWFDGTPVNAKKASLETDFAAENSNLIFEAVNVGTEGNSVTIEFVDPYDSDIEATAELDGNALVVTLGTDAYGEITTTAEEVVDLVEAIDGIEDVLTVELAEDYDTGVVEELAETALTGGQYATPARTQGYIIISGVWYICNKPVDKWTEDGWYSATPSLIS